MADALTCGGTRPCQFWTPIPGTTLGKCEIDVFYGDPPFDYQPCAYHSHLNTAPAQPTVDMQSQARGGPPWPNPGLAQWVKP